MANRRMFSNQIIDSRRFLQMPATTRLLYFDLGMKADDDGFVESFAVLRMTGASEDDLRLLAAKGYIIIVNDDLTAYIKDWTKNNQIRADRYHKSIYHELLETVTQMATSGCTDDNQVASKMATSGCPSIVEVSIGEYSLGEESKVEDSKSCPKPESKAKYHPEWFDRFWALYPKKKSKKDAIKAWDKLKPSLELCKVMDAALRKQMTWKQWQDPQFIPLPGTWIRGENWNDEDISKLEKKPEGTLVDWDNDDIFLK